MYCYLDMLQIEGLASNSDAYKQGAAYYKDNRVEDIVFIEEEENKYVHAYVNGKHNRYSVKIYFTDSGILKKYSCNCSASAVWRGGCKHVMAAMLNIFDMNRRNAVISRSMRLSRSLLDQYEKLALEEIQGEVSKAGETLGVVSLEPFLGLNRNMEPYLSFKITRGKKYILKNIARFLTDVHNRNNVSYGRDLTFVHDMHAFDSLSRELIGLMQHERDFAARTLRVFTGSGFYADGKLGGREMPLSHTGLDTFFDLYKDREVGLLSDNKGDRRILLKEGNPAIKFHFNNIPEGIELFVDESRIPLLYGKTHHYVLVGDGLFQVENDYFRGVSPLLKAFESVEGGRLLFPKTDFNRLNSYVFTPLRQWGGLEKTPEFEAEFGASLLKTKAYLDGDGGNVTCKFEYVYGEGDNGLATPPKSRDVLGEYRFKAMLMDMGFGYSADGKLMLLTGDDAIYDFCHSSAGLERLHKNAEVYVSDEFTRLASKTPSAPAVGLRIEGNLLAVDIKSLEYDMDELVEILESFRTKKNYHRLRDGRFMDFRDKERELEGVDKLFTGLGLTAKDIRNGGGHIPQYRALFAGEEREENPGLVHFDKEIEKLLEDFKHFRELAFQLPESLKSIMRPYQKEGFQWLSTLAYYGFGGILADDMGLGKTLQVISFLLSKKEEAQNPKPSIVVAPTSLIYNWEKEIARFAPGLTSRIISGTAAKRADILNGDKADIYITTYDMLKRDLENYQEMDFYCVIADEAQNIKNPATQNARALKALTGECRFALTGTPIENSLTELWSIFDFVMPGYLFSYTRFQKNYEEPIIKENSPKASTALKRQISPFILRRLKSDVLKELPEKIETTLYAEMEPEQKKLYAAFLLKARGELMDTVNAGAFNESRIEILSKLTRLRQLCCHPATFVEDYKGGSGKLDLTMETLRDSVKGGHRLLIFSQFTKMLAIIREELDNCRIGYFYLDGSTPSEERLNMVEKFNLGENQVFLISLKAGGSGLNLTGADIVIHYDPWWNPAVMAQASDRAHRIGQKKTVQIFNMVAKDSIEERILTLQSRKKDLVDTVIQEGGSFINTLSREEIEELFNPSPAEV